ncbi:MFS transporter [Gryllotalpicola reticulitermitis]|uniref:MFS transporter n=1 Tax=Gryllotalpicola reticulitermitis TaxID=1184153 RepID=A0ABV8Q4T1_9MICO
MSTVDEAANVVGNGPRAALADRTFRAWFAAQIFSASGSSTQVIGMSWLIVRETDSGVALGFLTFAIFVPVLLLGPVAGGVIDRFSRRGLLIGTQIAFLLIGTALTVLAALGNVNLPMIYGLSLLTGIVNALDGPARQVYLMDLVEPRLINAGIGLYEVVMNASRVLGPAVAGVLLATWGIVPCFVFNAVAFIPALIVLLATRPAHHVPLLDGPRAGFASALAWVRGRRDVAAVLVLAAVGGMLFNLAVSVPLLTTQTFRLGGGAYGVLVAVFGAGALAGALRASAQPSHPSFRESALLAAISGVAVLLCAAAPVAWVFAGGLIVIGFVSIWFIARANAFVQLASPPQLRGRVMSLWNMAIPGMNPFTGLAAGAVADALGARYGFALSGSLFVVIGGGCLIVWWVRHARVRER